MAAIGFIGDCTTTTSLAVAAGWPTQSGRSAETLVVECDRSGGSLAAWLDLPASPSLSTAVAALHQHPTAPGASPGALRLVEPFIRRSGAGVDVLTAPVRTREARTAIDEAANALLPLVASLDDRTALFDLGRHRDDHPHPATRSCDLVVVVHRQESASARAAAVRLERLAETVDDLTTAGSAVPLAVAIIDDAPFATDEIVDFVGPKLRHWQLPSDPLAAAVLAGRSGVSARRLARLPLMRAAADMASDLSALVAARTLRLDDHDDHHERPGDALPPRVDGLLR